MIVVLFNWVYGYVGHTSRILIKIEHCICHFEHAGAAKLLLTAVYQDDSNYMLVS